MVMESGDLLPQMYGMARISARHGMCEKRFLNIGRQFVPLRNDRCPEARKDALLREAQNDEPVVLLLLE